MLCFENESQIVCGDSGRPSLNCADSLDPSQVLQRCLLRNVRLAGSTRMTFVSLKIAQAF